MLITPAQSRAARGLVAMSQADLAAACALGLSTVRDFETERRDVPEKTIVAIKTALEKTGVEFIPENGGGSGVRLVKRSKAKVRSK
jgi:hypothetical protein